MVQLGRAILGVILVAVLRHVVALWVGSGLRLDRLRRAYLVAIAWNVLCLLALSLIGLPAPAQAAYAVPPVSAATVSANPYDFTLSRTPGPGDGVHRKIRPGAVFTYSESFNQRFGVQLSLSANQLYNEQAILNQTLDTASAARGPVINTIAFRDNPKITSRSAIGLNLDYKVNPNLVVALRTSGSHFRDEINSRVLTFRAASAQIDPTSTLTYLLAQPTANANTRLESAMGHSDKWNDTVAFSPKVEYKRRDLTLTAAGGYSRSRTHYEDRRSGYLTGATLHVDGGRRGSLT